MRQIRILHVSDTHFGVNHRCAPEDPAHPRAGYPLLFDLIANDLASEEFAHPGWHANSEEAPNPLLVVVTGDLTECAADLEFQAAYNFLRSFQGAKILDMSLSLNELFIVPGNHDVLYKEAQMRVRLAPYANFYTELFADIRSPVAPHEARKLTQLHVDEKRGFIVAEINSALYVQKDTVDEKRGSVDVKDIEALEKQLEKVPAKTRESAVRVAILHHHPVLVPELVETKGDGTGAKYDAVVNSNHLLKMLRKFGFQLVLHGHKHYPHIFSYDGQSAWSDQRAPSMLIVGGGSVSSRELPAGRRRQNSYNLISVKWHPEAAQARVHFVTRGLMTDDADGEMLPHRWEWTTLREDDRRLYPSRDMPEPVLPRVEKWTNGEGEQIRKKQYKDTRLNMLACEVLPSLVPGQAYEARVWVVPHVDKDGAPKKGWMPPRRVRWSAGNLYPFQDCFYRDDPQFCCAFNYWAPMVVQAEIEFEDGTLARAHVYARMPGTQPPPASR